MSIMSPVHKSMIANAKMCSKRMYYNNILHMKPEFINESSLAGSAMHSTIEALHKYSIKDPSTWDNINFWYEHWRDNFHARKNEVSEKGIELNNAEDIKAEDYLEMLVGYMKKPYNRYAEPILIETPFYFEIKRGRKIYAFAGTIDQLMRIKIKYLPKVRFSWAPDGNKDYVYVHRDIKTGKRHATTPHMLSINDDILVYKYALAYGFFDVNGSGICSKQISLIPYAHCLYYTYDHVSYKRKGQWGAVGDERGPAQYWIRCDLEDIKRAEIELINSWKFVNSGIHVRTGQLHNMCDHYCGFKTVCNMEMAGEV